MDTPNKVIIVEGDNTEVRNAFILNSKGLVLTDPMMDILLMEHKTCFKSELSLYISENIINSDIIINIKEANHRYLIDTIKDLSRTLGIFTVTKDVNTNVDTTITTIIKSLLTSYLTEYEYYDNVKFTVNNYTNTGNVINVTCLCDDSPTGVDEFKIPMLNLIAYTFKNS